MSVDIVALQRPVLAPERDTPLCAHGTPAFHDGVHRVPPTHVRKHHNEQQSASEWHKGRRVMSARVGERRNWASGSWMPGNLTREVMTDQGRS